MNVDNLIRNLDAVGQAELIHTKQASPRELVEASIISIEEKNPSLNALVATRFESALAEAETVDINLPFSGVPIVLKNISQSVKGEPLTAGSKLLEHNVSTRDSNFVKALKKAGFIIMGHSNTPEFGLKNITEPRLHGASRNPWNINYSPGGSSGGAAASVSGNMVSIAGASDGGGSIRIPASFCGLIGLKPTRGRMPVGPGVGRQWQGAAVDFALTKSVRDTAILLDQMQTVQSSAAFHTPLYTAGYMNNLSQNNPKTFRIGFITDSPVGTPVSTEAVNAVKEMAIWLEKQGHSVEEAVPDINGRHLMEQYYLMNSGEMAAQVLLMERSLGRPLTHKDMEIEGWVLAEAGKKLSAGEFSLSLAAWDEAAEKMNEFHQSYDLLLTPSTAFTAPEIGELTPDEEKINQLLEVSALEPHLQQSLIYEMFEPSLAYSPYTQLANLTGQPGISLPTYLSSEKLPMGTQFIAPKGCEHWLFDIARSMEHAGLFKMRWNR
ncbi:amidase [Jeotgalibacillus sp. S-D1]|uniref:amidase n=1 Tax=Jeotgalibacillus sp. S-D1 TaxID=2552189 RepID=UPI00105958B1|nr:amidase [Jeotgalibacillus sp. S-D1]TDL34937.1 amidase [Jeotgalibacillus sp. S-D1]